MYWSSLILDGISNQPRCCASASVGPNKGKKEGGEELEVQHRSPAFPPERVASKIIAVVVGLPSAVALHSLLIPH